MRKFLIAVLCSILAIISLFILFYQPHSNTDDKKVEPDTSSDIVQSKHLSSDSEIESTEPDTLTETDSDTNTDTYSEIQSDFTDSQIEEVIQDVVYEEPLDTYYNESTEEIITNGYTYSDSSDLFYLAATICTEAGGCSDRTKFLVGNVVMNRVESDLFPNSIVEVLIQPNQYCNSSIYDIQFPSWADENIQNSCYDIAQRLLDGERQCPSNVLFQAQFPQGSGIYEYIDGEYFCYY